MPEVLRAITPTPAEITDGANAWSQFVTSVGDVIEGNSSLLPLVAAAIGLGLVAIVLSMANVRLAHWIERLWQRRHTRAGRDH
ncbi:MAG: hypothetical protein ACF8R9_03080 [Phycisphaerales bacterium JB054]